MLNFSFKRRENLRVYDVVVQKVGELIRKVALSNKLVSLNLLTR